MKVDKEFDPINAAMIRKVFTDSIKEVIHARLRLEIAKIWDEARKEGVSQSAALAKPSTQAQLYKRLQTFLLQKSDLAQELLKVYEMDKGMYATFDHELIMTIFEEQAVFASEIIAGQNYFLFYSEEQATH